MRERKIKMVIETSDISNLSPSAASYFKLHKCENNDVEWKMILDNKMSTLIQVLVFKDFLTKCQLLFRFYFYKSFCLVFKEFSTKFQYSFRFSL